jgi:hypothetical protein
MRNRIQRNPFGEQFLMHGYWINQIQTATAVFTFFKFWLHLSVPTNEHNPSAKRENTLRIVNAGEKYISSIFYNFALLVSLEN